MIADYFSLLSARVSMEADLLLDFYRKHPGKLGEAREIILSNFFQAYLPKSLGVGSGFTMTSSSAISTEQDIVIFDNLNSPVLFPTNRSAIYPHSAVRAIVEVKSTLNREDVESSIRKAAAFKQAWRTTPVMPLQRHAAAMEPLACLFGFAGPSVSTLKANIIDVQNGVAESDRLDLVCLLNVGLVLSGTYFNTATFGQPGSLHATTMDAAKRKEADLMHPQRTRALELGRNSLLAFYHWMTSYMMCMPSLFPDLIGYAPTGMNWGREI